MFEAIRMFFLPSEMAVILFVTGFILAVIFYYVVIFHYALGHNLPAEDPASISERAKRIDDEISRSQEQPSRLTLGVACVITLAITLFAVYPVLTEVSRRWGADRIQATIVRVQSLDRPARYSIGTTFVHYDVSYTYEFGGSRYSGTEHVCVGIGTNKSRYVECEYFTPRVGDGHDIYVSRSNPSVSYFPRGFIGHGVFSLFGFGLAWFFFPFRSKQKIAE